MDFDPFRGFTNNVVRPEPPPGIDETMRTMRAFIAANPPTPRTIGLNDIGRRTFAPALGGLRIVEDATLIDTMEDWSDVRSPARAARRRRRGYPQRIRFIGRPKPTIFQAGDMLVMHPTVAAKLRAEIQAIGGNLARAFESDLMRALASPPSVATETASR